MASRRLLHALTRHATVLFSSSSSLQSLKVSLCVSNPFQPETLFKSRLSSELGPRRCAPWSQTHFFCSNRTTGDDGESDDDDEGGVVEEESDCETGRVSRKKEYTVEEREAEAAAIGYKVVGPLEKSDRVFKPYEPVFAVVQIGSHQFKVSNGDSIFTERLKFCDINDKLILNKILLLGSQTQTIVGRPNVLDAAVHAVVEEHALDAKVIIFKKKRRKNYRRTKGHRQELTKLRITDIQGIDKPEKTDAEKPAKTAIKKSGKVAVAA